MAGIEIYQSLSGIISTYVLMHTIDNTNRLEIKKSTGIIPFSLPVVDQTGEAVGGNAMVTEKIDFIHISGVEAEIDLDFEIGMNNMDTLLGLVSNKMGRKHQLKVTDWSGQTSGNQTFYGIVDSVRIKQEGGDPRVNCNMSFFIGANPLQGID